MKRLFFGFEIHAPWPEEFPAGRLVPEKGRHLTVAFLGSVDEKSVEAILNHLPELPFKLSPTGYFDQLLYLPENNPRVVSWNALWLEKEKSILQFVNDVTQFLRQKGFSISTHDVFLSHVTICRQPFLKNEWDLSKKNSVPLPFVVKSFSLYESKGSLVYEKLWSKEIVLPFEEMNHTADIGYVVRGENLDDLHLHAKAALSFQFPELIGYFSKSQKAGSIEEVIMDLNHLISIADGEIGCPFKAVSFHNATLKNDKSFLSWEMIIDV